MVNLPSLEVFKKQIGVALFLVDMVVFGQWLDSMITEVFSTLNDHPVRVEFILPHYNQLKG